MTSKINKSFLKRNHLIIWGLSTFLELYILFIFWEEMYVRYMTPYLDELPALAEILLILSNCMLSPPVREQCICCERGFEWHELRVRTSVCVLACIRTYCMRVCMPRVSHCGPQTWAQCLTVCLGWSWDNCWLSGVFSFFFPPSLFHVHVLTTIRFSSWSFSEPRSSIQSRGPANGQFRAGWSATHGDPTSW